METSEKFKWWEREREWDGETFLKNKKFGRGTARRREKETSGWKKKRWGRRIVREREKKKGRERERENERENK
jgi:hypothetical protein